MSAKPKFRFAPSPNGELHLGHAYSALLNLRRARETGGTILLRIEDIDTQRCTPELEKQMLEDLEWVGFEWDEPPIRQTDHFDRYREVLDQLQKKNLLYPATLSRGEIKKAVISHESAGSHWPRDPDGSPHYPGNERDLPASKLEDIKSSGTPYALRLHLDKALEAMQSRTPFAWTESSKQPAKKIIAEPSLWGDVVLARKDTPASYHLCCVVDDADQNITHIVRGQDLYQATSIHRLLQECLEFPEPEYEHHPLILDDQGNKLSKSIKSTGIRHLREAGYSPQDIRELIPLN